MKKMLLPVLFLFLLPSVFSYPLIISNSGVDHEQAKELVFSVPEELFVHVDRIEFYPQEKQFSQLFDGYAWAKWNYRHDCYHVDIKMDWQGDLYFTLYHELGHIYEMCELKKDYDLERSEAYADWFAERILKRS